MSMTMMAAYPNSRCVPRLNRWRIASSPAGGTLFLFPCSARERFCFLVLPRSGCARQQLRECAVVREGGFEDVQTVAEVQPVGQCAQNIHWQWLGVGHYSCARSPQPHQPRMQPADAHQARS